MNCCRTIRLRNVWIVSPTVDGPHRQSYAAMIIIGIIAVFPAQVALNSKSNIESSMRQGR